MVNTNYQVLVNNWLPIYKHALRQIKEASGTIKLVLMKNHTSIDILNIVQLDPASMWWENFGSSLAPHFIRNMNTPSPLLLSLPPFTTLMT